jgi:hypothetical protein
MRNMLAVKLAVIMVFATFYGAQAEEKHPNNTGCGLGSMAWEGQSGVAPQVFASTTNGTFGTQTFGITSVTSGCAKNGKVQRPDQMAMFIGPNIDKLAQDMSRGNGETLASLAEVIEIDDADRPQFYAATQRNFNRIIPTDNVTAREVATSINAVMAEDPQLRRYATL